MKIVHLIIVYIFSVASLFSQVDTSLSKEIIKKNWNIGGIPVIAYNSDLGLQYGVIINPFYYGDGSTYPNYVHKLYFEVSRYTKGSGIYRFYYNSKYLIPTINTFFDISYLTDDAYDFYGFNGRQSLYNALWIAPQSLTYVGSYFYDIRRTMIRVKADFQGKTIIPYLGWIAALQYRKISIDRPNFAKINRGKSIENYIPSDSILYDKYVLWNIIPKEQSSGGIVTNAKCGLLYDTRDVESNPSRGIWTEAVFTVYPQFLNSYTSFGICNISHRQYITLVPRRVIFAYRTIFQSHVFGKVPWYILPDIETSVLTAATNEGLGGAASLRGILRNRIVGKQTIFGNFELRYKFVSFRIKKQNVYIATNLFYDAGVVLQPINIDFSKIPLSQQQLYFSNSYTALHSSAGVGFKIAMNQNFIISIEHGKAFQEQDGSSGLYIRLNYLF
jgi:hypothetical protein